jgi:hypothetical protein
MKEIVSQKSGRAGIGFSKCAPQRHGVRGGKSSETGVALRREKAMSKPCESRRFCWILIVPAFSAPLWWTGTQLLQRVPFGFENLCLLCEREHVQVLSIFGYGS